MPRTYAYENPGTYKVKILGNLKSASFAGENNNGLTNMLVSVDKLDKNLLYLNDNAFANCTELEKINLVDSNILSAGNNAFSYCKKLRVLEYNSNLESIGDSCFSNSGLSNISPLSYESDIFLNDEYQYVPAQLKNVNDSIFAEAAYMNCFVVPENVQLKNNVDQTYRNFLKNALNISHIVFLGMNDFNSADYIDDIKNSNMFGLEKDCTFEGISLKDEHEIGTNVYRYVQGNTIEENLVEKIDGMTSYFYLEFSQLSSENDMANGEIYKYDTAYVDYCMNNQLNFMVLYLDSKTSARSKLFLNIDNVSSLFTNVSNAITFVLDRHNENGNVNYDLIEHYRKVIMDEVSSRQLLIHPTTNAKAILNFPELSFISKGGLKFQKMQLDDTNYASLALQIGNAAGNIFNYAAS